MEVTDCVSLGEQGSCPDGFCSAETFSWRINLQTAKGLKNIHFFKFMNCLISSFLLCLLSLSPSIRPSYNNNNNNNNNNNDDDDDDNNNNNSNNNNETSQIL
jgi:hypothetical protein